MSYRSVLALILMHKTVIQVASSDLSLINKLNFVNTVSPFAMRHKESTATHAQLQSAVNFLTLRSSKSTLQKLWRTSNPSKTWYTYPTVLTNLNYFSFGQISTSPSRCSEFRLNTDFQYSDFNVDLQFINTAMYSV